MATRFYSSYLLRLWTVPALRTEAADSLVLQVQNLQTGATWRLTSLNELNELLRSSLSTVDNNLLPAGAKEISLPDSHHLESESA